jgi:hypothetical protein
MEKESQNISTEKKERRFELPTEEIAKDRLDNFRSTIKQIQKEYPEFLGATVYGSMIKGNQATENSDVDAFLYIEAEDKNGTKINSDAYRDKFLEKLGAETEEKSKYYGDVRVQQLSDSILENEISDQLDFYKKEEAYKKMIEEKYSYDSSDEEKELLLKQEPEFRTIQFGIASMFHARVGSGIEKYRKDFLEKIVTLEDITNAEKLWNEVASQIRTYEQRKDPNIKIETPDTSKEALRLYNPGLYTKLREKEDQAKIDSLRQEIEKIS